MYTRDCKAVSEGAEVGDVFALVALSIQSTWFSMPTQWASYKALDLASQCLWGLKSATVAWGRENALRVDALRATPVDLMLTLARECPGLGLPKAGFVTQLLCYETNVSVGCFDLHNVARFGVRLPSFSKKGKASAQLNAALAYVELCEAQGGSEAIWDTWCEHLARVDRRFKDADAVSALHRVCVR